jgi:hypothetical protein
MRSRKPHASFQLEMLESRTLLAGADPSAALSATGGYLVDFGSAALDGAVTIAGTPGVDLTVDLARLPSAIKNLNITGFAHVTVVGTGQFDSLTLGNLESFWASGVDVQTVTANDVSALSLHAIKVFGTLGGHETRLEVFDSRSANIYSTLDKLTVASANDVFLISGNPNQEIRLDFRTATLPLGPTQKVILPGEDPITPPVLNPGDVQVVHPGENPSDVVTTVNGSTYTVVIISLSNAKDAQLSKLQDALKQGDFESARTLFSTYLKSGKSVDSALVARLPSNTLSELNLAEFGRIARTVERNVNLTDSHGLIAGNATDSSPLRLQLFGGSETSSVAARDTHTANDDSAPNAAPVSAGEPVTFVPSPSDGSNSPAGLSAAVAAPEAPLLELVRSALSNLTVGVDSQNDTVSAYIIGRLGDQFQPGVRPGLLVDAKPARNSGNRETAWIQV